MEATTLTGGQRSTAECFLSSALSKPRLQTSLGSCTKRAGASAPPVNLAEGSELETSVQLRYLHLRVEAGPYGPRSRGVPEGPRRSSRHGPDGIPFVPWLKLRDEWEVHYERGRYQVAPVDEEGIYRSRVIPGLWLRVDWLWRQPLPSPTRALLAMDRDAYLSYFQEQVRQTQL
jgi:hypothetical protein